MVSTTAGLDGLVRGAVLVGSEGYIKLWRYSREDFVLLLFGGGCILINIHHWSTTGRFEKQGVRELLLFGFVLVVLMGVNGGGTTSENHVG